MKYRVLVTGDGTSGAFELSHRDWRSGPIGVAFTDDELQQRLDEIPALHGLVSVTSEDSEKLAGPKSWDVEIPDELGPLRLDSKTASARLTGMCSPFVHILEG